MKLAERSLILGFLFCFSKNYIFLIGLLVRSEAKWCGGDQRREVFENWKRLKVTNMSRNSSTLGK